MFDFGLRIRELRQQNQWTLEMLGNKIGRSKSVVSNYENNTAIPPLEILTHLAVLFNVSLDYLVGIDKTEMLSVDGLSEEQKKVLYALVKEFKSKPGPFSGLTENQQEILNRLLIEFNRK